LQTFSAILVRQNFQVQTASSAATAKELLKTTNFDLVLTDMSMETSTAGFEVVKAAKSQGYNPALVIISAFPDLAADWKTYGADAMFHKPTILSELLSAINVLVTTRKRKEL